MVVVSFGNAGRWGLGARDMELEMHLCLRHVPDPAVHSTLEQMSSGEDHLVVYAPEFGKQRAD